MYFRFVDDMLSHNGTNGPESEMTIVFRQVRQVAAPRAKLLSTIAGLLRMS